MASELKRLRKRQADAVMPMVGALLDAWELLPNDVRSELVDEAPDLVSTIDAIWNAMEAADE